MSFSGSMTLSSYTDVSGISIQAVSTKALLLQNGRTGSPNRRRPRRETTHAKSFSAPLAGGSLLFGNAKSQSQSSANSPWVSKQATRPLGGCLGQ